MSKKPKLTPWFPASVKPARAGFYEREWEGWAEASPDYFSGKRWFHGDGTSTPAECMRDDAAVFDRRWRGLANPPKGGK